MNEQRRLFSAHVPGMKLVSISLTELLHVHERARLSLPWITKHSLSHAEISALQTKFREVQSHCTRFETCVDGLGALQQQVEEQRCAGQDGMVERNGGSVLMTFGAHPCHMPSDR